MTYHLALRLEDYFQALYGLGAAGEVNRFGHPNLLWLTVLMWEFPDESSRFQFCRGGSSGLLRRRLRCLVGSWELQRAVGLGKT